MDDRCDDKYFLGEIYSQIISGLLATPFMFVLANKVNKRGVFYAQHFVWDF